MTPEERERLEKYRKIMPLGRRGEAVLVRHEETGIRYVKKTLLLYDAEVFRILKREKFPRIPQIRELIEDDGRLIIIEEFIPGKSLEECLEERLFSEEETGDLICQLCAILKPLHRHMPQIIHRDIKPSNLILDPEGKLWLIDFDASRNTGKEKDRDTVLMGTQDYAAPEQYGFSQSTERTDIYGIGVVMNRMLTGAFPREKQASGRPGTVIRKCTQMEPSRRYRDVEALSRAVRHRYGFLRIPGFRSGRVLPGIPAAIGYLILLLLVCTLEITHSDGSPAGTAELAADRIAAGIIMFGIIFYIGNYLGVRDLFPWKRRCAVWLEALRILVGAALIFLIPLIVLVILFPAV